MQVYQGHILTSVPNLHFPGTLNIDCACSKILNHGLLLPHFKFFGSNNYSKLIENSGLKFRFLFCLTFQFYLMVQANLPETSPFFVCPNGFGEHLFSNVNSTWDV